MDNASAHTEGLKLLARRELSVAELRARLQDRGFPPEDIDVAIARLLESGALDDRRVAGAFARTAVKVKGRGRLRVVQELLHMGISQQIASEAVGEVYGELDERAMIDQAIRKKLGGRTRLEDRQAYARLYQFLMRQGFTPAGVVAALRRFRTGADVDHE